MGTAEDRETIAWLHRRAGFGLAPDELEQRAADGVAACIERLVDPDRSGVPAASDPWAGQTFTVDRNDRTRLRQETVGAIGAWLDHLASTHRPLESWMTWFWHGLLVSGLDKVKVPGLMVGQLRTYQRLGFAPFPDLLRAATVDPAMLIYLDGRDSTGANPNENYAREVMELFALGIGHHTEDDVKAAARALTGWRLQAADATAVFVPRRHDDSPQTLLGVVGVHDVDSVIAAITSHPACPVWVAGKLARAVLGPDLDDSYVQQLGAGYEASSFDTRQLMRTILSDGADGRRSPMVWAPVPWLAAMTRATGTTLAARQRVELLRAAGQVPMSPPNVAGWPGGRAWLSAATVIARIDLAAILASSATEAVALAGPEGMLA